MIVDKHNLTFPVTIHLREAYLATVAVRDLTQELNNNYKILYRGNRIIIVCIILFGISLESKKNVECVTIISQEPIPNTRKNFLNIRFVGIFYDKKEKFQALFQFLRKSNNHSERVYTVNISQLNGREEGYVNGQNPQKFYKVIQDVFCSIKRGNDKIVSYMINQQDLFNEDSIGLRKKAHRNFTKLFLLANLLGGFSEFIAYTMRYDDFLAPIQIPKILVPKLEIMEDLFDLNEGTIYLGGKQLGSNRRPNIILEAAIKDMGYNGAQVLEIGRYNGILVDSYYDARMNVPLKNKKI